MRSLHSWLMRAVRNRALAYFALRCVLYAATNGLFSLSATPCGLVHSHAFLLPPSLCSQEHGDGTLVKLMPDTFQVPDSDSKLFARTDGTQHPQHDRAAAVVERARRWIALSVRTMSGGPDKLSLRILLMTLAVLLLGACIALACLAALARLPSGQKL